MKGSRELAVVSSFICTTLSHKRQGWEGREWFKPESSRTLLFSVKEAASVGREGTHAGRIPPT